MLAKVYIFTILDLISVGLIMPLYGPYMLSLGASNISIGLFGSFAALVQLVTNPVAGNLSDRKGRKYVLLRIQSLTIVCNALLMLWYNWIPGIHFSRTFAALFSQSNVVLKAFVADSFPQSQQTSIYGKIGSCMAIGFVVGPILGGRLLSFEGGFFYLALILTVLSTINLAIAATLPDSPKNQQQQQQQQSPPQPTSLLNSATSELTKTFTNIRAIDRTAYGDIFLFKLLTEFAFHLFVNTIGLLLLESYSLTQQTIGFSIAAMGTSRVFFNIICGRIKSAFYSNDKSGLKRTLQGLFIFLVSFIGLYLSPSYWVFMPCAIGIVASKTVLDVTWTEMVVARCGDKEKGVVMGSFESIMHLARMGVPILNGVLREGFGTKGPVAASVVSAVVGVLVAAKAERKDAKKGLRRKKL